MSTAGEVGCRFWSTVCLQLCFDVYLEPRLLAAVTTLVMTLETRRSMTLVIHIQHVTEHCSAARSEICLARRPALFTFDDTWMYYVFAAFGRPIRNDDNADDDDDDDDVAVDIVKL